MSLRRVNAIKPSTQVSGAERITPVRRLTRVSRDEEPPQQEQQEQHPRRDHSEGGPALGPDEEGHIDILV